MAGKCVTPELSGQPDMQAAKTGSTEIFLQHRERKLPIAGQFHFLLTTHAETCSFCIVIAVICTFSEFT
jgi:hypothetical protein